MGVITADPISAAASEAAAPVFGAVFGAVLAAVALLALASAARMIRRT